MKAWLRIACLIQIFSGALPSHAQVLFTTGENDFVKQRIEYLGSGWRNFRTLGFVTQIGDADPNTQIAYWACGSSTLIFPSIYEPFADSSYVSVFELQGFGAEMQRTLITKGYAEKVDASGSATPFRLGAADAAKFVQAANAICAKPVVNISPPEGILVASSDNEIWKLEPARMKRNGSIIDVWIAEQPYYDVSGKRKFKSASSSDWRDLELTFLDTAKGYSIGLRRFDCDEGLAGGITFIDYNVDGSVKDSTRGNASMSPVAPGTMGESVLELVCLIK